MTEQEILIKAEEIVNFKDAEKVGNQIFRFVKYDKELRLQAAIKYLKTIEEKGSYFNESRGKKESTTGDSATLKQWDWLQNNRVETGCKNYGQFVEKYTKMEASKLISAKIDRLEDGYEF